MGWGGGQEVVGGEETNAGPELTSYVSSTIGELAFSSQPLSWFIVSDPPSDGIWAWHSICVLLHG